MLGAGPAQVRALDTARRCGLQVAVSDQNPRAPGFATADFSSFASTFDTQAVIRDARRIGSDVFMTTGTDQPVLTAARASRALGLPYFLTPRQALMVTNKKAMKQALDRAGLPSAKGAFLARDFDDSQISPLSFPLVIKPLDSQGQRGVLKVHSPREIRERFDEVLSFSRQREILAEEYYPSTELTVSGWAEEGRARVLLITDRVTFDNGPHLGVCLSHRYPSLHHHQYEELSRLTQAVTEMIGLRRGPLYFQILAGERGFQINEIACRLGGAYEDEFIPALTGVPLMEIMVAMTAGLPYEAPRQESIRRSLEGKYLSLQMFFYEPGELARQSGMAEVTAQPGILGGQFLLPPGTIIHPRHNSTQRAGYFIVTGFSREEVNRRIRASYDRLDVRDPRGRPLLKLDERMMFPHDD